MIDNPAGNRPVKDDTGSKAPPDVCQVWCSEFTAKMFTSDNLHKRKLDKGEATVQDDNCTICLRSDESNNTVRGSIRFEFTRPEPSGETAVEERDVCFGRFERCLLIKGYKLLDLVFESPEWKNRNGRTSKVVAKFQSRYEIGEIPSIKEKDIQDINKLLSKMKDNKPLDYMADHMSGKIPTYSTFVSNWTMFNKAYKNGYPRKEWELVEEYLNNLDGVSVNLLVRRNHDLFECLSDSGITRKGKNKQINVSKQLKESMPCKDNRKILCHATSCTYQIRNSLVHENKLPDLSVNDDKPQEDKNRLLRSFVFDLIHIETIKANKLDDYKLGF